MKIPQSMREFHGGLYRAHLDTATIMEREGRSSTPETITVSAKYHYAKRVGARNDVGPDRGGGLG